MTWLPPGTERIVAGISRVCYAVWLVVAFIAWGRIGNRLYTVDGSLDVLAVGIFAASVIACMVVTAWGVRLLVSLVYGWRYTEMDHARYDRSAVADAGRQATIDRRTGR